MNSSNINNSQLISFTENLHDTIITESCLNFVDLAGSEKISNSNYNNNPFCVEDFGDEVSNSATSATSIRIAKERAKES